MTRATLANGLRLVISPRPRAALTALKLFIKVGSRHDGKQSGISHFVEHLMLDRPSREPVTEQIEALGGEINAVTHREYTALQAVVLAEHAEEALRLFRELLQPLELVTDRLERERDVILQEIEQAADSQSTAWDLFLQALWGENAFTRPIYGDPAVIRDLTPAELSRHFSSYAVPQRMVLAVAGPVVPEDVSGAAEREMTLPANSDWHDHFTHSSMSPHRCRLVRDTKVARLIIGVDAVPLADPRRAGVKILDMVLGQGTSSRLYQLLRNRWGLVYDAGTAAMAFEDRGYLCAYTSCAPANLGRVMEVVLEEFERLAREPIGGEELERARTRYEGMLARRFETVLSEAGITGIEELLASSESFEQAMARVREVEPGDALRVAGELIDLDRMAVAVVGPSESIDA